MSTETIMFHQAVADTLGLHVTDHKCLDFMRYYPLEFVTAAHFFTMFLLVCSQILPVYGVPGLSLLAHCSGIVVVYLYDSF